MYYIVSALNIMMQNIVRGLDKVKNVAIGGIINSTLMFSLNILFLLVFKLGLIGYFWATILSNFISFTYLFYSLVDQ